MPKKNAKYWLVKSEPEDYSIDDLARDGSVAWTGVRNYQARNFMRDEMQVGDLVLYYHSGGAEPALVGMAKVARAAYPDPTQFDKKSKYHDPKATRKEPRWMLVDLAFEKKFDTPLPLKELKQHAEQLDGMPLLQRGQRLSVQPVSAVHFKFIEKLAKAAAGK